MHLFLIGLFLIVNFSWANVDVTNTVKAIKFREVDSQQYKVFITFEKPITSNIKSFTQEQPPRIVFDIWDVKEAKAFEKEAVAWLVSYDIIYSEDGRMRLVLQPQQELQYQYSKSGKQLVISFKGKYSAAPVEVQNATNSIKRVDFNGEFKLGKVTIALSKANMDVDVYQRGENVILNFNQVHIPRSLMQQLDVKDFGSPVQFVNAESTKEGTKITIISKEPYQYFAYQVDNKYIVDVRPFEKFSRDDLYKQQDSYRGKPITLNFQDIKVRAVLQMLADFTGINMVVSDSVSGSMTLRLNAIPWDQALKIILSTQGLAKRQEGDVLLIAPSNEIAARETQELKSLSEVADLAPLKYELIQVNYARAEDLSKLLKDQGNNLLSKRGNISVDARTNHLWIQDIPERLQEIRELISKLDIPVKQVQIEARIVSVNNNFERDLGIRWGITSPERLSGTLEGANQGIVNIGRPQNVTVGDRLNVDLGASATVGRPAKLGLALAKLGSDVLLDLELSALESENRVDIISTPRVLTANQKTAIIESGEDIPFQQATSSGATAVTFKKAVLKLEVTPQITPDNRIILDLAVNSDEKGQEVQSGIIIQTKAIKTQVLVENGETIVLGGIYKHTKDNKVLRVPFLSQVPVVGNLFKNTQNITKKDELLVFITPKIVHGGFG